MKKMKKLRVVLSFLIIVFTTFSCIKTPNNLKEKKNSKTKYIYEASYLDDFKIGNNELVLKVQKMHQYLIEKDFKMAATFFDDDIVFILEDGIILEGKSTVVKHMVDNFSVIKIQDYEVDINFSVTGDNGDEWVFLWDNANILLPDGNSAKYDLMEAFQFVNGKITKINQFSRPIIK